MKKEASDLEKLKKEYEKYKIKYNLPNFEKINEDFEIEKLQGKETDLFLREVRRSIIDKIVAYLRFIETFINPVNAPLLFLTLIKSLEASERKSLHELYLRLGKFEIESVVLDNVYDEKKESEFIKKIFKEWQETKKEFDKVVQSMMKNMEAKGEMREKGYLG